MITKERLLSGLRELIHVEEDAVAVYTKFTKALIKKTEAVGKEKREKMEKILSKLYQESARHKETINNLYEAVEKGIRNEY